MEKTGPAKIVFAGKKIGFFHNIFFLYFYYIKYCCTAYIILTSISVLNSTLIVLVTYLFGRFIWPILPVLSLTNGIVTPTPKLLGTNL